MYQSTLVLEKLECIFQSLKSFDGEDSLFNLNFLNLNF